MMLGEVIENILSKTKYEKKEEQIKTASSKIVHNIEYLKDRLKQLQLNKLASRLENANLDEQTYLIVDELLNELEKRAYETSSPFIISNNVGGTKIDPITKFAFGG